MMSIRVIYRFLFRMRYFIIKSRFIAKSINKYMKGIIWFWNKCMKRSTSVENYSAVFYSDDFGADLARFSSSNYFSKSVTIESFLKILFTPLHSFFFFFFLARLDCRWKRERFSVPTFLVISLPEHKKNKIGFFFVLTS